jgi:hypothetical protein
MTVQAPAMYPAVPEERIDLLELTNLDSGRQWEAEEDRP